MRTLLLLLLPLYAFAHTEEEAVVNKFLNLQGELQKRSAAPCATCAVAGASVSEDAIACVQKICKPKDKGDYVGVLMSKKVLETRDQFQKGDFPPAMVKDIGAFKAALQESGKLKAEALRMGMSGTPVALSPFTRALLNVNYIIGSSEHLVLEPKGDFVAVNEEETRSKLRAVNSDPAKVERSLAAFQHLYNNTAFVRLILSMSETPPEISFKILFGGEAEAAEKIHAEGERQAKKIAALDPTLFRLYMEKDPANRAGKLAYENWKKSGVLSPKEQKALMDYHLQNATFNLVLFNEKSPFLGELVFDPSAMELGLGTKAVVQSRLSDWNAKAMAKMEASTKDCYASYLFQSRLLPGKAELGALEGRIKLAKAKAKTGLGKIYSEETSQKMGMAIEQLQMFLPKAKEGLAELFHEQISERVAALGREKIGWATSSPADKSVQAYMEYVTSLVELARGKKDGEPEQEGLCDDLAFKPYPDAMYEKAGINVGPMLAVTDEEAAVGVLLHELAHFISREFRGGKSSTHSASAYRNTRQCLGAIHPESIAKRVEEKFPKQAAPYPVSTLTEEDHADFLSGIFQGATTINSYCDLMPVDMETGRFEASSTAPAEKDSHSGSLLRLMHYEWQRGMELQPECLSELKKTHPELGAKNWCSQSQAQL